VISRRTHIFHSVVAALLVALLASVGLQASPEAVQARPLQQPAVLDANPKNGVQGQQVTFTITIPNNTGVEDTFTPSVVTTPNGFNPPSFSPSSITLQPNVSGQFQMTVDVPASQATGQYTFVVAITYTGGSVQVQPSINVVAPTNTIPPTPANNATIDVTSAASVYADLESIITYNFSLRNTSGENRTYTFQLQNTSGAVAQYLFDPTSVSVLPGDSQTFMLRVVVTNNRSYLGQVVTLNVQAVEGGGVRASTFVQFTVTENNQTPTRTLTPSITPTNTPTTGPSITSTPPICEDAYEPDNDMRNAKLIEVNLPQPSTDVSPHVPTHTICPAGDEDWLYFGALAGKVYTIDITEMSLGLDLSLALYDSEGRMLAFNDDYYNRPAPTPDARNNPQGTDYTNLRPRIQSWTAPYNGIFYIQVRDAAGKGRERGWYSIVLQSESYGPTPTMINELCLDMFEPDGLPEQARLITSNEVQIAHTLCPSGDADWSYFFAKAGKTYMIFTDTRPYASQHPRGGTVNKDTEAGADTIMFLVDRDGVSLLDFNDDIPGGNSLDSQIEFTPSVDGFYFIQVKNIGDIGNQFIRYDLTLQLCLPGQTDCGRPQALPATPTLPPVSNGSPSETPADFNLDDTVTPTMTDTQEVLQQQKIDQVVIGEYQPPILRFWNYISSMLWNRAGLLANS
jgi:NPCBM-associated, NEW3 domain of alpha-galactosidase./Ubp3 associated protein Bre5.